MFPSSKTERLEICEVRCTIEGFAWVKVHGYILKELVDWFTGWLRGQVTFFFPILESDVFSKQDCKSYCKCYFLNVFLFFCQLLIVNHIQFGLWATKCDVNQKLNVVFKHNVCFLFYFCFIFLLTNKKKTSIQNNCCLCFLVLFWCVFKVLIQ